MVDLIASDAHNLKDRAIHMKECYEYVKRRIDEAYADEVFRRNGLNVLFDMNDPQPTNVEWGFCYAASRHEPADPLDPAEQGMSTMPLSHWVTFGNTFLKMFPAPLISALVMVPS